jgi:hypothetical protein
METFINNKDEISHNMFDYVSQLLLNETYLIINKLKFRICEIEFYLYSKDHKDKYVHCCQDQLEYGKFYFHKFANGTYKNGTFKGMDITLGTNNNYCGILIRSMYDITNKIFISGPCNCVNKILELYEIKSINEFANNSLLNVLNNNHNFVLKNRYKYTYLPLYYGPRIGLSDKYEDFQFKKYRYIISIKHVKKNKKALEKVYEN